MKSKTLHMIGNAHIDPVWLWQWTEGFHEVKATFRSALDRMKEYPDFTFTASSAAFYEWVEQSDPTLFAEIKARVAEGRWQVTGGWWVEPDCNIPGGESFARHGLYAQRYFQQKFGVIAHAGYCPDSFGHHGMLPQILRKSGLDNYVFMRPETPEKDLPGWLFWWESDDGSRVLAYRIPYSYGSWGGDLVNKVEATPELMAPPIDELMSFYGVGDHGGGPTRENIDNLHELDQDPAMPGVLLSTPDRYFTSVRAKGWELPVVHDDLQHHSSGCYSVNSTIKRTNRQVENLLMAAEKMSLVANWVTGQPYPHDLDKAWKNVLFNQFHDVMAGTSIEPAYHDAQATHGESIAIGQRALNLATQALVWRVKVAPEECHWPILVFNPHAWAVKANIQKDIVFYGLPENAILLDSQGRRLPFQLVQGSALVDFGPAVSFTADLPALGYTTFMLVSRADQPEIPSLSAGPNWLENGRWKLAIDPATGAIASLVDKTLGVELFRGLAARAVVIDDPSDTWSHGVFRFDNVTGAFQGSSITLSENGPVKSTLTVRSSYGASHLEQAFTLYAGLDRIDVAVTVDWHESQKLLKLRFPVAIEQGVATYEIPYGTIERPMDGEEEPGQAWVDVSGVLPGGGQPYGTRQPYGVSLINDGKYSYDIQPADIGLTVLRSPIFAHHMPAEPDPARQYTCVDQGIQHFNYALLPHTGTWKDAGTVRAAAEFNQPPVILIGTAHPDGALPKEESYISVEPANIIISVVKKAEDSDAMVLRAYETDHQATLATLHLPHWGRTLQVSFGPCEIKTLLIPRDPAEAVVETDLLERPLLHA